MDDSLESERITPTSVGDGAVSFAVSDKFNTSKQPKNKTAQKSQIHQYEIDSFARVVLPAIQVLFETEEGKKEFEEWKTFRQVDQRKKE